MKAGVKDLPMACPYVFTRDRQWEDKGTSKIKGSNIPIMIKGLPIFYRENQAYFLVCPFFRAVSKAVLVAF